MSYCSVILSDVPDDQFYSPSHKATPSRTPRPGEPLWSFRKDGATWSAELRYHGEFGVEAQILRESELVIGRRFDTRALAVQWADEERKALARYGWMRQQKIERG